MTKSLKNINVDYFQNITEIIRRRKSCRTYTGDYLSIGDKQSLEEFICLNNTEVFKDICESEGVKNKLFILEKGPQDKKMKLLYGAIKGNKSYLLGVTKDNPLARVNYAYKMEKLVLKATELGLGTCWIGYFDHNYFGDLTTEKGYVVPGVVLVGYAADKRSLSEKLVRFSANASQRMPREKLFFDYKTGRPLETLQSLSGDQNLTSDTAHKGAAKTSSENIVSSYSESLEMLRLAPSSSNSQPWRVYFDQTKKEFHFFKKPKNIIYEKMGMHDLDMGIAMAHFELTSQRNGLTGSWVFQDGIQSQEGLQYIVSYLAKSIGS